MTLRNLQIEAEVSNAEIAKYVGVTRAVSHNWIRGKHSPNAKYIKKLAEILKTDVETIVSLSKK